MSTNNLFLLRNKKIMCIPPLIWRYGIQGFPSGFENELLDEEVKIKGKF